MKFGIHGIVMGFCVVAMGAGAYLFLGRGGEAPSYLFLIFLACPLMHLFMGHGSHGSSHADSSGEGDERE